MVTKFFSFVLFFFERRDSKCATPLFPPVDTILTALFVGSSTLQIIGVTNKERWQAAQWEALPKTGAARCEHEHDRRVGNKRKQQVHPEKTFVKCGVCQGPNLLRQPQYQ